MRATRGTGRFVAPGEFNAEVAAPGMSPSGFVPA